MQAPNAILAAGSLLQPFATLIVLAIVAGMAAFGFYCGLFLATLAGIGAIATLFVTLGLSEALAGLLVTVEMPAAYALPVSIGLLAVGGALGVRFAIGGAVPEDTLRFAPLIDRIGGTLVGGLAGIIMAGTLLVVLSALPIPETYAIDGAQTKYDLGARMLTTFARLIEPDATARQILLNGEVPVSPSANSTETSELFIDTNRNGVFDPEGDGAERHLDHDGDGRFSPRVTFLDINENGVRDIGLLERYRLRSWQNLRVQHYPTITSGSESILTTILGDGQEVYKAVAVDLDPDDAITFSLRDPEALVPAELPTESEVAGVQEPNPGLAPPADVGDDAIQTDDKTPAEENLFAIDPTSGSVTVKNANAFMQRTEPSQIIIVATDMRGLSSEKVVSLIYRGVMVGR